MLSQDPRQRLLATHVVAGQEHSSCPNQALSSSQERRVASSGQAQAEFLPIGRTDQQKNARRETQAGIQRRLTGVPESEEALQTTFWNKKSIATPKMDQQGPSESQFAIQTEQMSQLQTSLALAATTAIQQQKQDQAQEGECLDVSLKNAGTSIKEIEFFDSLDSLQQASKQQLLPPFKKVSESPVMQPSPQLKANKESNRGFSSAQKANTEQQPNETRTSMIDITVASTCPSRGTNLKPSHYLPESSTDNHVVCNRTTHIISQDKQEALDCLPYCDCCHESLPRNCLNAEVAFGQVDQSSPFQPRGPHLMDDLAVPFKANQGHDSTHFGVLGQNKKQILSYEISRLEPRDIVAPSSNHKDDPCDVQAAQKASSPEKRMSSRSLAEGFWGQSEDIKVELVDSPLLDQHEEANVHSRSQSPSARASSSETVNNQPADSDEAQKHLNEQELKPESNEPSKNTSSSRSSKGNNTSKRNGKPPTTLDQRRKLREQWDCLAAQSYFKGTSKVPVAARQSQAQNKQTRSFSQNLILASDATRPRSSTVAGEAVQLEPQVDGSRAVEVVPTPTRRDDLPSALPQDLAAIAESADAAELPRSTTSPRSRVIKSEALFQSCSQRESQSKSQLKEGDINVDHAAGPQNKSQPPLPSSHPVPTNQDVVMSQSHNSEQRQLKQRCESIAESAPSCDERLSSQRPSVTSRKQPSQTAQQSGANAKATGRWTRDEHYRFLEALKIYGKEWKRVQQHVGTRSSTQARSHAQKFFVKLDKKQLSMEQFLESLDMANLRQMIENDSDYCEEVDMASVNDKISQSAASHLSNAVCPATPHSKSKIKAQPDSLTGGPALSNQQLCSYNSKTFHIQQPRATQSSPITAVNLTPSQKQQSLQSAPPIQEGFEQAPDEPLSSSDHTHPQDSAPSRLPDLKDPVSQAQEPKVQLYAASHDKSFLKAATSELEGAIGGQSLQSFHIKSGATLVNNVDADRSTQATAMMKVVPAGVPSHKVVTHKTPQIKPSVPSLQHVSIPDTYSNDDGKTTANVNHHFNHHGHVTSDHLQNIQGTNNEGFALPLVGRRRKASEAGLARLHDPQMQLNVPYKRQALDMKKTQSASLTHHNKTQMPSLFPEASTKTQSISKEIAAAQVQQQGFMALSNNFGQFGPRAQGLDPSLLQLLKLQGVSNQQLSTAAFIESMGGARMMPSAGGFQLPHGLTPSTMALNENTVGNSDTGVALKRSLDMAPQFGDFMPAQSFSLNNQPALIPCVSQTPRLKANTIHSPILGPFGFEPTKRAISVLDEDLHLMGLSQNNKTGLGVDGLGAIDEGSYPLTGMLMDDEVRALDFKHNESIKLPNMHASLCSEELLQSGAAEGLKDVEGVQNTLLFEQPERDLYSDYPDNEAGLVGAGMATGSGLRNRSMTFTYPASSVQFDLINQLVDSKQHQQQAPQLVNGARRPFRDDITRALAAANGPYDLNGYKIQQAVRFNSQNLDQH